MSELFGNHIVGFPTRRLILVYNWLKVVREIGEVCGKR